MSTKSSYFFFEDNQTHDSVHLYHEMHDDCVHLHIAPGVRNTEANIPLPEELAKILLNVLDPRKDWKEQKAILDEIVESQEPEVEKPSKA